MQNNFILQIAVCASRVIYPRQLNLKETPLTLIDLLIMMQLFPSRFSKCAAFERVASLTLSNR